MSIRTLRIYGTYDKNTVINVTVDNVPADNVLQNDLLYSFTTSTELHGKRTTNITVLTGKIQLGKITATYPALINGVDGYATFIQPIENPLVTFTDKLNFIPKDLELTAPNTIQFDHLMLNGASKLIITSLETIKSGQEIYIGDLRNPPTNGLSVKPEYTYTPLPNKFNQEDFEKLVDTVYPYK